MPTIAMEGALGKGDKGVTLFNGLHGYIVKEFKR
jgi:hypothetical protein